MSGTRLHARTRCAVRAALRLLAFGVAAAAGTATAPAATSPAGTVTSTAATGASSTTAAATAKAAPAVMADPWQTRLPAFSQEDAPRGENPILLYFTADWCGFCKRMERGTLADPKVRGRVGDFRAHRIDFDAQGGLVKRFGVRGIPAFVLTNDRGELIDRLTGAVEADAFLSWLDQADRDFARRAQSAADRAEALRALPQEARSADATVRARAVASLWELAGRGDEFERPAAETVLAALLAEDRKLWRAGLGHTDLAVRVAAVRLLQTSTQTRRDFDPWADAETRAAALEALERDLVE